MGRRHHPDHVPDAVDRALAAALGPEVAWIRTADEVLAARRTGRSSAVLALVQAVWADDPAVAHHTLRRRLATTTAAPGDHAVVKVCARRWTVVPAGPAVPTPPVRWLSVPPPAPLLPLDPGPHPLSGWAEVARGALRPAGGPTDDRPVVALLVGPDGGLLGAAHNRAGRDRSRHAELVLLHGVPSVPPDGSTLLVTLQCCRMCAALVDAEWPRVAVRYLERDPGRFARGTALAGRELPLAV